MLLSTYLIDKKNIDKGSKQVRKLCFADADSNPAPLAQSEVDELQKQWAAYSEPIMPVLRQVQQLVRRLRLGTEEIPKDAGGTALVGIDAQRKAELLSQLVVKVQELSSKGICIPHSVADAVTIVMDALDSPMLVLRLLGLAATKYMCYDKAFYEKFLAFEGFMLVGICFDSEQPQELDYALTLVQNLTRLKIEGVLDTPVPHYIVSRVVSFLDPIDCRGDATFQLRSQAMDVLRQMLAAFPSEVAAADGVRPLLQVCLNPETSRDEVERTIPAVVRMFEDPVTRVHLRPGDLDVLFCPFTDSTIPDRQRSEIMPVCRDVICKLLCSWGGLFWLSTEASGIRCLIDLLHLPGRSERKFSAISLFNQVLRRLAPHRGIPTQGPWEEKGSTSPVDSFSQDFDVIDGEELLSSYGVNWHQYLDGGVGAADEDDIAPVTSSIGYHSLDVFLGTLLLVLNHHGLPRALISLMRHSAATEEESERGEIETTLMKEAAVLLQHIIVLMDTLLPQSAASSLHAALNEAIASLATDGSTFAGGLTTTLFHNLAYTSQQASIFSQGASFNSNALGVAGVNAVEMDEARFTALVKDTHVDSSEYAKWNLESLFTLVQEPLRNPTRLRFLKEKTPILSRLMQFFRFGSKGGYCSLTVDIHARWTALGIALLDVLLLSRDGVEIIEKGDFCKGIRELIDECNVAQNGAFRQRTENSVMREYFRFLGRFTLYANGLLLLKKHCILESLCSLLQNSHQRSFFDAHPLCCLTLQHLYIGSVPNYGVCDELRAILQAAMSHPDGRIKRVCVAQIGRVLFRDLSSSMEWGVSRLLDGLQDTDLQVVDRSYKLLASVCFSSVHALDYLIDQKPEVLLNSKLVWERRRQLNLSSLLYRMLGRPNGFGFLNKFGWVATELQQWSSRGSSNFVNDLETIVRGGRAQQQATGRTRSHSRTLSDPVAGARGHRQNWGKAVTSVTTALHISHSVFPDHFIQELCRHDAGCAILTASPYFQKCAALLMSATLHSTRRPSKLSGSTGVSSPRATLEEFEPSPIRSRRQLTSFSATRGYAPSHAQKTLNFTGDIHELTAAMYDIAFAGSSDTGFLALQNIPGYSTYAVVIRIMDLACFASHPFIRGNAMVALSVLARSNKAAEYLRSQCDCHVIHELSGYSSPMGIPYSVCFVEPSCMQWMYMGNSIQQQCGKTTAHAYANGPPTSQGVAPELLDPINQLLNPIQRELAKQRLYSVMKEKPQLLTAHTIRYLREVTNTYRVRHTERKFIFDCISKIRSERYQSE